MHCCRSRCPCQKCGVCHNASHCVQNHLSTFFLIIWAAPQSSPTLFGLCLGKCWNNFDVWVWELVYSHMFTCVTAKVVVPFILWEVIRRNNDPLLDIPQSFKGYEGNWEFSLLILFLILGEKRQQQILSLYVIWPGDGDGEYDDYADHVKLTCPDDHDNDNGCKVVSPKYWSVVPSRDDS